MPALAIAATAADTVINPGLGFARVSIFVPVASAVRVLYHQAGHVASGAAASPDTGAASLAAGDTIVLNFNGRPVYLNTPGNVGGTVNYSLLE